MPDRTERLPGWARRLFGRPTPASTEHPGRPEFLADLAAVLRVERAASEALYVLGDARDPWATTGTTFVNAFGSAVQTAHATDPRALFAAAVGSAAAGLRTAVFVSGDALGKLSDGLRQATARRIPLLVHADLRSPDASGTETGRGHDACRAVADSGAFVLLARDAQQAVDAALIARRVAEATLTPGVVALDGPSAGATLAAVRLPELETVREIVGAPADQIACPTPAERLLFGDQRRRVPRWFDLERVAASGVAPTGADRAAADLGRRAFFDAALEPLADEARRQWASWVGREQPPVSTFRVDDAQLVLVAQGSTVALAEAVAERLRATERIKVGVLGIHWLRPFPVESIRAALGRADTVTVLERSADVRPQGSSLTRELRAALQGAGPRLLCASFSELTPDRVVAACRNMQAGASARDGVRLDVPTPAGRSEFPRREVLLERMRRDFPGLQELTLDPAPGAPLPGDTRTVVLHLGSQPPEPLLRALADALSETVGTHLHGTLAEAASGTWRARLTAAGEPFAEGAAEPPAQVWLGDTAALERSPSPGPLDRGAAVAVAFDGPVDALAARLSPAWRAALAERDLRLFRAPAELRALIDVAVPLLAGELPASLAPVPVAPADAASDLRAAAPLPLAVRRFGRSGSGFENVARFWGEFIQPRKAGENGQPVPDPYLAVGVVPPVTSTFHDAALGRVSIPLVDPERCTGCGECWASCPDAAISAVALPTEGLLQVALDRAEAGIREAQDPGLNKLRRLTKQWAARIDGVVAKDGARQLRPEVPAEAFDWMLDKLAPEPDEREILGGAARATLGALPPLRLSATERFFHRRHAERKGSGEWLTLSVNPQSCQGCGICAAVCPDDAIRIAPQTGENLAALRQEWEAWESLPDTPGATIARESEPDGIGGLAAILMSRHCLFTLPGGDAAEPGSGERLAVRQVVAVVEFQMQRRLLGHLERLAKLSEQLTRAIQGEMTRAAAIEDLGHLEQALDDVPQRHGRLGQVLSRLEELGEQTRVDVPRLRALVRAAREVDQSRRRLTEGEGRARFGVVLAGARAAAWAASFPRNPFAVPVTVDIDGDGIDLASGIARGLLAEHLEQMRQLRHAELLLDDPSDLPARERELAAMGWRDLPADELALCPPVLVIGAADGFGGPGAPALASFLAADLPLRLVLLDDRDLLARTADPADVAIGHGRAFVLATSVAHRGHLFDGVSAALEFTGPAMIHTHAPSPRRDGFDAARTVERAHLAVDARVQPLVRFEPAGGERIAPLLSLDGNPAADRPWAADGAGVPQTPVQWAAGERRFREALVPAGQAPNAARAALDALFPDGATRPQVSAAAGGKLEAGAALAGAVVDTHRRWAALQSMAAVLDSPFVEGLRDRVKQELSERHQAEIAALRAEHERKLEEFQQAQVGVQLTRLRDRLMQLAGFRPGAKPDGRGQA